MSAESGVPRRGTNPAGTIDPREPPSTRRSHDHRVRPGLGGRNCSTTEYFNSTPQLLEPGWRIGANSWPACLPSSTRVGLNWSAPSRGSARPSSASCRRPRRPRTGPGGRAASPSRKAVHVPVVEVAVRPACGSTAQAIPQQGQPAAAATQDLLAVAASLDEGGRPAPGQPQVRRSSGAIIRPLSSIRAIWAPWPPRLLLDPRPARGEPRGDRPRVRGSRGTRLRASWGVKPRSLNHAQRERGLNRTANSSSISWFSREAVHSSVAQPMLGGTAALLPPGRFSPRGDGEFAGPARYEAGRQALPSPRSRERGEHTRQTVRGAMPRNSATSSAEYPSRDRWTASWRRCSSSSEEPLVLIPQSVKQADAH